VENQLACGKLIGLSFFHRHPQPIDGRPCGKVEKGISNSSKQTSYGLFCFEYSVENAGPVSQLKNL